MTTKLKNVVVHEVSLVAKGANGKRIFLRKADEGLMEDNKVELEKAQAAAAEAKAALEKAAAEQTALTEKLAALEKAQAEAAASAAAEKAALEKAQAEAVTKAAELEKALEAEREAKEVAECIRKAADEFKNLPEKAEDLGPLLRKLRKADSESAEKIESLLRKLNAVAKGALDNVGTATAGTATATAWEEIEKRAKALVGEKKVATFAQGVTKALRDDPALYAQHESEKNSRV